MSKEVYVCVRRSDIPEGTLQVLDLDPNESQRNLVYTAPGQTKYLNYLQNDVVSTFSDLAGNRYVSRDTWGLAAYLIDHIEAGGLAAGTDALTAVQANNIAAAIIAEVVAGNDLDLPSIDAVISGVVADTELTNTVSASNGSVSDVLMILSGARYVVPAGSMRSGTGGTVFVAVPDGHFAPGTYRQLYDTSSFKLSNASGRIHAMKSHDFEFKGVSSSAVTVYDEHGFVI